MAETPSDADASDAELLAAFEAFVPRYVAWVKQGVASHDLTLNRLNLLRRAAAEPQGAAMSDLARALGVTPYAVTKLADALEREGLVARRPNPADRRSVLVVPTPQGLAALDDGGRHHRENMQRMLAVLTPEEQEGLLRALRKMTVFVDGQGG